MNTRTKYLALILWATCTASTANAQLTTVGAQLWHQGSTGIGIVPEPNARVGGAVAAGDFNCDGFDDAAIGMPLSNSGMTTDAGRVLVIYANGNGSGLNATGRQTWWQSGTALPSDAETGEQFGRALAVGDFNNDGCGDLAIGVPFDNIDAASNAGSVHVVYGSPGSGLSGNADDYLRQGTDAVDGAPSTGDFFGSALTVGDFNADGYDDLAVGAPGEDLNSGNNLISNAGVVHIAYGSFYGLDVIDGTLLARGTGLPGTPTVNENVGSVLAAGELDTLATGDELAIGLPLYDFSATVQNAGGVFIVRNVDAAPAATLIDQETPGVDGAPEVGDTFGSSLAIGDFDADGLGEIAIGANGEDKNEPLITSIGSVTILEWQSGAALQLLQDDLAPETLDPGDAFGSALATGDFDGDGTDDLAIGVALEDFSNRNNAGLVHVLYGGALTGIRLSGRQTFYQEVDPSGAEDRFGAALAVGRFDAGSGADLMIGSPYNSITVDQTGSASVFYSID